MYAINPKNGPTELIDPIPTTLPTPFFPLPHVDHWLAIQEQMALQAPMKPKGMHASRRHANSLGNQLQLGQAKPIKALLLVHGQIMEGAMPDAMIVNSERKGPGCVGGRVAASDSVDTGRHVVVHPQPGMIGPYEQPSICRGHSRW